MIKSKKKVYKTKTRQTYQQKQTFLLNAILGVKVLNVQYWWLQVEIQAPNLYLFCFAFFFLLNFIREMVIARTV